MRPAVLVPLIVAGSALLLAASVFSFVFLNATTGRTVHGGTPGQGVSTDDCAPVPCASWHNERLAVIDTGLEGGGSQSGGLSVHLGVVVTNRTGSGQSTFSRGDLFLVYGSGAVHETQTVDGPCPEWRPLLLQPGESSPIMDVCFSYGPGPLTLRWTAWQGLGFGPFQTVLDIPLQ